jgi:hypothetical protein
LLSWLLGSIGWLAWWDWLDSGWLRWLGWWDWLDFGWLGWVGRLDELGSLARYTLLFLH